jgi:C-terminal processing protease CtpA/Prc
MKPRRRSLANIEYFRQNAMESLLKSVQMRKSNLSQDFPSRLVRRRCTISEIKFENKVHCENLRGRILIIQVQVEPDSPAEREDIRVGDKLIRANGTRLDQLPHREMQRVLQESRGHTELVLLRRTKSMDSREFRPEVSSPSHNLEKKQKEVFLVKAIE